MKITRLLKLASKAFKVDDNKVVNNDTDRANKTIVNMSKNNKSKKLMHLPNIGAMVELNFLTSNAKKVFNHLQLAFVKAPIF